MENSNDITINNNDYKSNEYFARHLDTRLCLECFSINEPIEIPYEFKHTNCEPVLSDDIIDKLNKIRDINNIPISIQSAPRKKFKWYQINWFRRIARYIRISINKIKYPVLRRSPEELNAIVEKLKEREI